MIITAFKRLYGYLKKSNIFFKNLLTNKKNCDILIIEIQKVNFTNNLKRGFIMKNVYYYVIVNGRKFEFAFLSLWAAQIQANQLGGYVVDKYGNKV